MGLQETIKAATVAGVKALGNLVTQATFHSTGTFTVTPATGGATESSHSDETNVEMMFIDYLASEIDGQRILSTDQKILIPANNLTATPKNTDYIESAGLKWYVIDVGKDPAGALWQLQSRLKP